MDCGLYSHGRIKPFKLVPSLVHPEMHLRKYLNVTQISNNFQILYYICHKNTQNRNVQTFKINSQPDAQDRTRHFYVPFLFYSLVANISETLSSVTTFEIMNKIFIWLHIKYDIGLQINITLRRQLYKSLKCETIHKSKSVPRENTMDLAKDI